MHPGAPGGVLQWGLTAPPRWQGSGVEPMQSTHYGYVLENLVARDFKIRYRNMSLGVFWSLLNPLVMMLVLTFVFTGIFANRNIPNFPVFLLCGLVPYNFFALSWLGATTSVIENASLIKRVRFPREIMPISSVLANCVHLLIQMTLLLFFVVLAGYPVTEKWLWLPLVLVLEVVFVCGLALLSSSLDVYFRDVRYVVESSNMVLFWLVPIFYSFQSIAPQYHIVYQYNPLAAVILACRQILLEGASPAESLLTKLAVVSIGCFLIGYVTFARLKRNFGDYL
jgi:lipopolysaccharide transport system permease protein